MSIFAAFLVTSLLATQATAHIAIWTPAMFGSDPSNPNSDNAAKPLANLPFKGWWFHDNLDKPPQDPNAVVVLPAGGTVKFEMSSNKAHTSMGRGLLPNPEQAPEPWTNTGNGWGNMHANTRAEVAGSALAIAYKSNAADVTPDDFVVFSVAHDSPARQLQSFSIPSQLPSCPNNKCICAWFWIHDSRGGGDEMYMTGFQCNVSGGSNKKLGKPRAPQRCDGDGWDEKVKGQKGKCVVGAKNPMYWKNQERMNMFEPGHWAPTYSAKYGWKDGAQEDIFEDGRIEDGSGSNKGNQPPKAGNGMPKPMPTSACNCNDTPKRALTTPPPLARRECPPVTSTVTVTVLMDRRSRIRARTPGDDERRCDLNF